MLWGLNWPAMKLAVGELSVWTFRAICTLGSGVILLGYARLMGERLRFTSAELPGVLFLALFGVVGWNLLSAFGLQHIEGGRGAVIAYTMPVWAALLGTWLLKEQLSLRVITALALGLLGIAVLIGPDLLEGKAQPLGAALMVLAALVWAIAIIALKSRSWSIGIIPLTGWQLLFGSLPIVAIWLAVDRGAGLAAVTPAAWAATAYATIIGLGFCYTAYNKVVTLLPATVAAISTLAIPVVGLGSSALLLGEPAGAREVAALILVIGALSLVLLRPRST